MFQNVVKNGWMPDVRLQSISRLFVLEAFGENKVLQRFNKPETVVSEQICSNINILKKDKFNVDQTASDFFSPHIEVNRHMEPH